MRALMLSLAIVTGSATVGCRAQVDVAGLERRLGPDGAADALTLRLAADPRDAAAWRALAIVETERQRPGAALVAFERAAALGAPFRAGLAAGDARRLAALLIARAEARVARRSPGADADVARAAALGAAVDPTLRARAALIAIAGELAHVDPRRRDAGAARLRAIDPGLAGGLAADATDADVAATAAWLRAAGARRLAFAILDRRVEDARGRGARPAFTPAIWATWLALRRWWSGPDDPIDQVTLDELRGRGVATCAYARGPRDPGCDVVATAGSADVDGAAWEPALVEAWQRDGWRAADADAAMAWMIVAARAVRRGQLPSWEHAVRSHVDVAAVAATPGLPRWAAAALAVVAGAAAPLPDADAPAAIVALAADRARAAGADGWPALAAAVVADGPEAAALAEVVRAYGRDPALADRRAEAVAATALDLAAIAPRLARAFALLGDPARARAWWQRGFDASPEEPALALGLALAAASAGDGPAALQLVIRAAAGSGDAAATLYAAARGLAAAGLTLDALSLARQAIEQAAPGDEDAPADLAAALLRQLGRDRNAAEVARLVAVPGSGDLAAVTAEAARLAGAPAAQALARWAALARADDPAVAQRATAALAAIAPRLPPPPAAGAVR
ncbi:MAG: hypothetical protein IPH44_16330 [Myxococcales bacterium]|nr:hypothetical protein [Myxococcales bacterium]